MEILGGREGGGGTGRFPYGSALGGALPGNGGRGGPFVARGGNEGTPGTGLPGGGGAAAAGAGDVAAGLWT